MRFSSTVDSLTKENHFLRTTTKVLILAVLLLSLAVLFLHDKNPVVVERSSRGLEIVRITSLARTEKDIELALKLMMQARFDTAALAGDAFISKRQMELRETEQQEMKSRGLTQSIILRKSKITKEEAVVEFDRVLTLGDVRSALKAKVKVAFEESEPNELNPYGLKLTLATPIEQKEEKR